MDKDTRNRGLSGEEKAHSRHLRVLKEREEAEKSKILQESPDKVMENKIIAEQEEKVRRYQAENKRLFNEIIEDGLTKGAMAEELNRLANGGTDFSLFNLMLERVDFRECHNMLEAMRKMYENLWPFYARTILENAFLRKVTEKAGVENMGHRLSEAEMVRLHEILQGEVDPNGLARRTLEEIRALAKKRRELNLY